MEKNRNYYLAIGLSILVLFGWQYFYLNPKLEAEKIVQEQQAKNNPVQKENTLTSSGGTPALSQGAGDVPGSVIIAEKVSRSEAMGDGERIVISTPELAGTLNLTGARFDDLKLNNFHENIDPTSKDIEIFSPQGLANAQFAEIAYTSATNASQLPSPTTKWALIDGNELTPSTPVVLEWKNGSGLTFTRTVSVDDKYLFTIADVIENDSGEDISFSKYGRITRLYTPDTDSLYVLHEGLIGVLNENSLHEIDYDDLVDDGAVKPEKTKSGWLGITDKYWASALVPEQGRAFQPRFSYFADGQPRYQADYITDAISLKSGQSQTVTAMIFAGAKLVPIIDRYEVESGIPKFELLIDWGWFHFITKPLFWVMDYFHKLVGNFGVAILLTTVIVKLFFFPLANKSYSSMANMKKVQPKMEELKARHGDDRAALQKDMMALYKKEKINPVAGCWPMLLQIPVFFALYKVLYVTIEMRHAPFFGWIQDLSAPDPTSLFNLFGLLPYDVPSFLMIGVWPLIMGITMFLQMRMNPTPADPTQQMIFTWMPVMFTFMLASFPAGLVIYWAWNNSLSILQQGVIMKRQGVKIELWDNVAGLFSKKNKPVK